MEEKNNNVSNISPERRARINRLKKILVTTNFTIMFTAIILCVLLSAKVCSMGSQIEELEREIALQNEESVEKEPAEGGMDKEEQVSDDDDMKAEDIIVENEPQHSEYDKVAYLTFDDGPSKNTKAILDILDEYNVKGTFFVNGKEDKVLKAAYKEIVDRGHSLGLHSYTHEFDVLYESLENFASDTERLRMYIYQLTGKDVKIYRFPGGSSTSKTESIKRYIDYLNENGYIYYDWNVSSEDAVGDKPTAQQIVQNVMGGVDGKNTAMILMHDSALNQSTVDALPTIIEKLIEEGYTILPIEETTLPVHHMVK